MINEEMHSFTDDYLIGHQQTRNINSTSITDSYLNNIFNNEETNIDNLDININNNLENNLNNEISASSSSSSNQEELGNNSLNTLEDNDLLDISKNSNLNETLADTGEPIALCRLRRQAVRILASRIRTEKQYYEVKETELKEKLDKLSIKNLELEKQLEQLKRPQKQLFLISTAFVFCSLIGYFLNNLN